MSEPTMPTMASSLTNVQSEHRYSVRCTFGATTVMTYRSAEATPTRPSATTVKISFPKAYTEISNFHVGRKAAAAVAGLEWIITTNNIDVDGTVTLTSIVTGGTATAPATGDVAYFEFGCSSDQLNDRAVG